MAYHNIIVKGQMAYASASSAQAEFSLHYRTSMSLSGITDEWIIYFPGQKVEPSDNFLVMAHDT